MTATVTDIEIAPRPPLLHRSVSQLTSWIRCGEAYRLEKVARAPRQPAAWFTQGTAFHEAIENWEKTGRTHDEAQVRAWYDEAWTRDLTKDLEREPNLERWLTGGRTKAEKDIANREAKGREQASAYVTWAIANQDRWRILEYGPDEYAVEVPFSIDFDGVEVIGYIDQIIEWDTGEITPRDLKTGTKLPESALQLGVYGLAITQDFNVPVNYGDFYMAKNNDATAPSPLASFTHERVGRWFRNMDKAVKMGLFLPNVGDACRVCGVADYCDAKGRNRDEYAPEVEPPVATL